MSESPAAIRETALPLPLVARGKVRDVYETPNGLLIVATDRLSAFDVVFDDPIPLKGEVLTRLSVWWFEQTRGLVGNHLVSDHPEVDLGLLQKFPELRGRCILGRRAEVLPVECVVRGYLEGSAWVQYRDSGLVCGVPLPPGLRRRQRLDHPIFTPTTKAAAGHDLPMTFAEVVEVIGLEAAEFVRKTSVDLYRFAHDLLLPKGIVLSDTKFEFGRVGDEIILVDEILTPDSSRFWEADTYVDGADARSFDKQYVRDYVESIGWDKRPPAPRLPREVIQGTTRRYTEILELIAGIKIVNREEDVS
ncbi:MAG: phosphoribosylaminoimidazolesuccinocarboxamide synthase [Candidatus Sumerlaeaceae bacterium]|nr:phosphoribosylaminoimidazolesuccinocarboxamide synthase [Candidatus Sumerlaeaceae bacterium]